MSLRQLRARLDRLEAQFPEGDEESIARARQQYLYRKLLAKGLHAHTESEAKEWDNLWRRFQGRETAKLVDEVFKKADEERAKAEEKSRLRQQKKAAAAARLRSEADSSYCPGEIGGKETSRFSRVEPKREAAAAGVINYEDNSDCWAIDDDDDL
jgi:hypothetical protein